MTRYKKGYGWKANEPMDLEDAVLTAATSTFSGGSGIESHIIEVEEQAQQSAKMMAKLVDILYRDLRIDGNDVLAILNSGSNSWDAVE